MELSQITPDTLIKQHNDITSGKYDFSACQLDILFMLLALLKNDDLPNKTYNIRVKDIELITKRKWNYVQVEDATDNLMSRVYNIVDPIGKIKVNLFSRMQYIEGTGSFDVEINSYAKHLFFNLKHNFTYMQLNSVLSCKSKYSKRIYAYCCQWRSTGGRKDVSLSEFKEILGLKDSKGLIKEQYVNISDLKLNVLEKAKKQINGNTDILFDYSLKKRRSSSYDTIDVFAGMIKPEFKQGVIDFNVDIDYQKKFAQLIDLGIGEVVAQRIVLKNWKEFETIKKDVLKSIKDGKIEVKKDIASILVGVLKNKGVL